jgi:hypothetical protein
VKALRDHFGNKQWRALPMYNGPTMSDSGASFGGKRKFEGAGGTSGGVGEFFIGALIAAVGFYLLFSHVQVHSSYWNFMGLGGAGRSFGISLIPLLFGVGILFVNGKSTLGWFLSVGGLLFILAGILINLDIYFQRTSLMNTLIMLFMIAAGLGLVVKGLRPHRQKSE